MHLGFRVCGTFDQRRVSCSKSGANDGVDCESRRRRAEVDVDDEIYVSIENKHDDGPDDGEGDDRRRDVDRRVARKCNSEEGYFQARSSEENGVEALRAARGRGAI